MTFSSDLDTAAERFLSRCLQQVLIEGWSSSDDFLATFGPEQLMGALDDAPELRAEMLVRAAGVHERIAPKKSTAAAAEDLQLALDEGVCNASQILEILDAEQCVRYLDADKLWTFVTSDPFWTRSDEQSLARVSFVLETALDEELIGLSDLVDGVTVERLAEALPKEILERALIDALNAGRNGDAYDEQFLFDNVPLDQWVRYVPLEVLWHSVVTERVAASAGLAASPGGATSAAPVRSKSRSKKRNRKSTGPRSASPSVAPPPAAVPPASAVPAAVAPPAPSMPAPREKSDSLDLEVDVLLEGDEPMVGGAPSPNSSPESRTSHENSARRRAEENLRKIDRLPSDHMALPSPVLLAIDSMYADLLSLTSDAAREECIRDAFPNTVMLNQALLALAAMLDPKIDRAQLARQADVDSMIKLVLFEERRRADRARKSMAPPPARSPSTRPPPPSGSLSNLPPPLPTAPGAQSQPARSAAPPPPPLPSSLPPPRVAAVRRR